MIFTLNQLSVCSLWFLAHGSRRMAVPVCFILVSMIWVGCTTIEVARNGHGLLLPKEPWPYNANPLPDAIRTDGVYLLKQVFKDKMHVSAFRFWKDGHVFCYNFESNSPINATAGIDNSDTWDRLNDETGTAGMCKLEKPYLYIVTIRLAGEDGYDFYDIRALVNEVNITIANSKRRIQWVWDDYNTGKQYSFLPIKGLNAVPTW